MNASIIIHIFDYKNTDFFPTFSIHLNTSAYLVHSLFVRGTMTMEHNFYEGGISLEHYLAGVAAHMEPTLAIFFAAFIQSITGFGLVIIAAPLLMFFYEPKLTVPIMLLLACSGNAVQGFLMRKQANLPLIRWMYLGMLAGQPIGFFFFTYISNDALKVFINIVVLLSLLLMQISHRRIPECRRNTIITGMLSGFTAITTGMGGLPFLIYLA